MKLNFFSVANRARWISALAVIITAFVYFNLIKEPVVEPDQSTRPLGAVRQNRDFPTASNGDSIGSNSTERQGGTLSEKLLALMRESPEKAKLFAMQNFRSERWPDEVALVIEKLCEEDIVRINQLTSEIPSELRGEVLGVVAYKWVRKDPTRMKAFLKNEAAVFVRAELSYHTINQFISADNIANALEVFSEMPFSRSREQATLSIVEKMTDNGAPEIIRFLNTHALPDEKGGIIRDAAFALSRKRNLSGLEQLGEVAEDPSLKAQIERFTGKLIGLQNVDGGNRMPQSELEAASAISSRKFAELSNIQAEILGYKNPIAQSEATQNYVKRVFAQSPETAAKWVTQVDKSLSEFAIRGLVQEWYQHDSEQVSDWLNKLPTGRTKDSGLERLAILLGRKDKQLAQKVAAEISTPNVRERVISSLK